MRAHSANVCDEHSMHSMNSTKESAAILTASAPPMMPTQYIGFFHFMHIISYHPINPQWYMQIADDAISTAIAANCSIIFVVSILASL